MIKRELDRRLYRYAVEIVKCVDSFSKDISAQVIARQLIRSGTSVVANVVEAKGSTSKKDYINYYTHSLKSANESKLWIGLARDTSKISESKANTLLKETKEIANILGASIITMRKNIIRKI